MRTTSHHIIRSLAVAIAVGVALAPAAAAQQDLRSPDSRDWAAGRGPDKAPVVEFVEVPRPNGFDWADAGLGAAAGIGLMLIGVGTAVTAARLRRRSVGPARA